MMSKISTAWVSDKDFSNLRDFRGNETSKYSYIHTLFFNVGRKVAAKKADVDLPTVYKKL